jgi:hypothetical protein
MSNVRSSTPSALGLAAALVFSAAVVGLPATADAQNILPFSEIRPGMTGVGRTVFSGTRVEEFKVEVIGTLENIGPHRNLILGRLSGGPLAQTGVMAGMSGSPVYIGDRLVGAVAYSWGFAKEPIAGIVPFQEMLAIEGRETPDSPRAALSLPSEAGPLGLRWLADPARLVDHFAGYLGGPVALSQGAAAPTEGSGGGAVRSGAETMTPIGTPLLLGGFPGTAIPGLTEGLGRAGLRVTQGGTPGRSPGSASVGATLEPGSAVGIGLVRGDIEISAICTVTHREGDRLWACGHPLLGLGPTELAMTTATVSGLLPSLEASFKFATAQDDIGVFRQDRATGVFGFAGRKARTIPVRLELQPERGRPRRLAFSVAADPFLAPYLVYAALNGILSSEEKDFGEMSFTYNEGSVIRLAGEDDIRLGNLFAGDLARLYASGTIAFLCEILLDSEYRTVQIDGIDLVLGVSDTRRTARLLRAWVSRDRVRAGETVQVSVGLKPFRGPEITREMNLTIPREVPPGRLMLQVGDATALARTDADHSDEFVPRDLGMLIRLINRLRRNDRLYAVLTRTDNGLVFQGERLPNLPPSVSQVMARPQTRGNYSRTWYRGVSEESVALGYAVEGYRLLSVDVEP